MALQLNWYIARDNLLEKDEGVYIIYSHDQKNNTYVPIRVGQGVIKHRLAEHSRNTDITRFPALFVMWAPCFWTFRDNVEKYLADVLNPIVGERFPDRIPLQVNTPFM